LVAVPLTPTLSPQASPMHTSFRGSVTF
jgi:hypothetical protein